MNLQSSSIAVVLAHPDDFKSVTGILMRALDHHSQVLLILVTKGEALTSIAQPTLSPWHMGELRIKELRTYLREIHIQEENLVIIGIPDGSSTLPALRDDFYQVEGEPYLDPLLKMDHVAYDDVYKSGLPFFGRSLQEAIQDLLSSQMPNIIFTHHPKDDHADHRAVSFFTRCACYELYDPKKLTQIPQIFAPLVYYQRCSWPPVGNYFYVDEIKSQFPQLTAVQFMLTEAELETKKQASQVFTPTLSVDYILNNMKKDEVVWRL